MANKRAKSKLDWIESEIFEKEDPSPYLEKVHGILVPGGFGERGSEGKITGCEVRARTQGAVFRHLLRHADGLHRSCALAGGRRPDASSTEFGPDGGTGGRPDDRMAEGQHAGEAPR
jgi:CTP synthase